jgi:hypothetical protein
MASPADASASAGLDATCTVFTSSAVIEVPAAIALAATATVEPVLACVFDSGKRLANKK